MVQQNYRHNTMWILRNGETENDIHFFFQRRNYDALRKDIFKTIKEIEEISLEPNDRLDKLRLLFSEGWFKLLNMIGKFISDDNANANYTETLPCFGSPSQQKKLQSISNTYFIHCGFFY